MKKFKKLSIVLLLLLMIGVLLVFTSCSNECKNGHTVVEDAAVEATCDKAGLTAGSHCSVCNEVIKKQETIPATDHKAGGFKLSESDSKITHTCVSCDKVYGTYASQKIGDAWVTDEKAELDLTSYAVVYRSADKTFIRSVTTFAAALSEKTGLSFTPVSVDKYDSEAYKGEILIGNTGKKDSDAVAKLLESGYNFVIRTLDKKLVIVGSTDDDVAFALDYIIENYLNTYTNAVSFPICALGTNPRKVAIDVKNFSLVIDHNLYDLKYHAYVSSSTGDNTDYTYRLATSFATRMGIEDKILKDSAELPSKDYISVCDGVTYEQRTKVVDDSTTHMILFGEVEFPASVAFRENLPANCHGFKIVDENMIVIIGHNDIGLEKAMDLFRKEYLMSETKVWPAGYTSVEVTNEKWIVDFPQPLSNDIKLYNTQTSQADTLQFLYRGAGVSEKAFDDYCEKLKKAGYAVHGEITNFGGNKYATLVNEAKGIVLNVVYNPYLHQDKYSTMDATHVSQVRMRTTPEMGYVQYTVKHPLMKYEPCLRVISSSLTAEMTLPTGITKPYAAAANTVKVNIPPKELLTKDYSYKKVTETSVTAVGLPSGSVGMSYVIQLEDGSFIVIDGGYRATDMKKLNDEGDILYKTLSTLHEKAFKDDGMIPSTITIRAWYLTHSHYDHFYNFNCFMYQYGKGYRIDDEKALRTDEKYKVDVNYILAHVVDEPLHNISAGTSKELMLAATYISAIQYHNDGGAEFIRTHAGQSINFANVTLEVLMTPEDYNPYRIANTNDSNTVMNIKISSKDDQKKETELLILGDSCIYQSRYLCATYGDYLESDMVQFAHHGNIGSETALYNTVKPTIVWYPHTVSAFKSYSNPSSSTTWPHSVTNDMLKLDCVKYVYVSGAGATWNDYATSMSGIGTVTLKFNGATPLYDAPCDTLNGDALLNMGSSRAEMSDSTTPIYKNPLYKEK